MNRIRCHVDRTWDTVHHVGPEDAFVMKAKLERPDLPSVEEEGRKQEQGKWGKEKRGEREA